MKANINPTLAGRKPIDRKLLLLIGIVAATVIAILYQAYSGPPVVRVNTATVPAQKKSAPPASGQRSSLTPTNPLLTEDPDFLPQLQKEPPPFENEKRNLFAFHVPAPPPPPPPPEPVCGDGRCNGTETYQSCASDCPPPPPPPVCGNKVCENGETYTSCPDDCDPPPPPEISLKYIGYLKDNIGAVAFLTDGKEVFMGRLNDIIANRYRVVKITEEGVELGYVNLRTGQSKNIPFEGNNKN